MCLRRRVALDESSLGCHIHAGDGTCGRERQQQMKNDEAQPSPEAAREEFFPGV
jgi:hypothetical protein